MKGLSALLCAVLIMSSSSAAEPSSRFTFPDPLTMEDGTKIRNAQTWKQKRVPELKHLFQTHMYGHYPAVKTQLTTKVLYEDRKAFDGLATLREMELSFGIKDCPPLHVLLTIPNHTPKDGAPVFVGLTFQGNHAFVDDPRIRIPTVWMSEHEPGVTKNRATAAGRGQSKKIWPLADIIKAGFATATCYYGEIAEDRRDTNGPLAPFVCPPARGDAPNDATASIMLWAWSLHRIIDYVETVPGLDRKRIAVVGHSRLGKTAILAGAFDDRIACLFPHQAGCGGTAPSRHADSKAESVKRINAAFPHWFSKSFQTYNEDLNTLPIDQHELLALCAPRPVLYTNAADDLWANPNGQFEMMKLASPVYGLHGVKGLEATTMPKPGILLDSRLGFWMRDGKHDMNPDDWKAILLFAEKWMN